jgi:hypothetical protein
MRDDTPECPFCGKRIMRPEATKTDFGEVLSGTCQCGTIFVCDPTGHGGGEAYLAALALMKGDRDIHLLDPDKDYVYEDFDYDIKSHKRLYTSSRRSMGKLVFVKLRQGSGLK